MKCLCKSPAYYCHIHQFINAFKYVGEKWEQTSQRVRKKRSISKEHAIDAVCTELTNTVTSQDGHDNKKLKHSILVDREGKQRHKGIERDDENYRMKMSQMCVYLQREYICASTPLTSSNTPMWLLSYTINHNKKLSWKHKKNPKQNKKKTCAHTFNWQSNNCHIAPCRLKYVGTYCLSVSSAHVM